MDQKAQIANNVSPEILAKTREVVTMSVAYVGSLTEDKVIDIELKEPDIAGETLGSGIVFVEDALSNSTQVSNQENAEQQIGSSKLSHLGLDKDSFSTSTREGWANLRKGNLNLEDKWQSPEYLETLGKVSCRNSDVNPVSALEKHEDSEPKAIDSGSAIILQQMVDDVRKEVIGTVEKLRGSFEKTIVAPISKDEAFKTAFKELTFKIDSLEASIAGIHGKSSELAQEQIAENNSLVLEKISTLNYSIDSLKKHVTAKLQDPSARGDGVDPASLQSNLETIYGAVRKSAETSQSRYSELVDYQQEVTKVLSGIPDKESFELLIEEVQITSAQVHEFQTTLKEIKKFQRITLGVVSLGVVAWALLKVLI